jgi:hypothetical protein
VARCDGFQTLVASEGSEQVFALHKTDHLVMRDADTKKLLLPLLLGD